MAITKTVTKQTLTLNVEDGVNSQGAAKTKGHNYAGVRPEAEPAAIMQAAAALGTLISHELMGVVVTEKAELAQGLYQLDHVQYTISDTGTIPHFGIEDGTTSLMPLNII